MAERIVRCRALLGTFVEVTADDEGAANAAYDAIAQVHALMSAHDPASDLSRVNRLAPHDFVEVHPWTAEVLARALHWSRESGGVFDVVRAGKTALQQGLLPLHPGQNPPEASRWTAVHLDGCAVRLSKPGCIDLGGIAKGYAADRAVAAMKAAGATSGLVNAGGDIAGFGVQPWPVQVLDPESRQPLANVAVCNGAIATSSVHPDGSACHLDGRSAALISATVCASSAMDSDALTKIVLSGSPAAADCLGSIGAEAFVLTMSGEVRTVAQERQAA